MKIERFKHHFLELPRAESYQSERGDILALAKAFNAMADKLNEVIDTVNNQSENTQS